MEHIPDSAPARRVEPRAVMFDFDGTLFDASEAIIYSFNEALRMSGAAPWPRARILELIGRPLVEMFPLAVPDAGPDDVERLIADYRAVFHPVCVELTRELPGLRPCLAELARMEFVCAIVTNRARAGACRILEGFGLQDAFPVIIGIDDVTRTKPHPEPVHRALADLDIRAERSVLVGDTREDMRAADNASVRGIGVLTGAADAEALFHAGAAAIIPSLAELPGLLRRLFAPSG